MEIMRLVLRATSGIPGRPRVATQTTRRKRWGRPRRVLPIAIRRRVGRSTPRGIVSPIMRRKGLARMGPAPARAVPPLAGTWGERRVRRWRVVGRVSSFVARRGGPEEALVGVSPIRRWPVSVVLTIPPATSVVLPVPISTMVTITAILPRIALRGLASFRSRLLDLLLLRDRRTSRVSTQGSCRAPSEAYAAMY
eukprot:scaffold88_cov387-Prasinococcus_capsulatus_cf.AAC.12